MPPLTSPADHAAAPKPPLTENAGVVPSTGRFKPRIAAVSLRERLLQFSFRAKSNIQWMKSFLHGGK